MNAQTNDELMAELGRRLDSGAFYEDLFTDDAVVWYNHLDQEFPAKGRADEVAMLFEKVVERLDAEDVRVTPTPTGCVIQKVNRAELKTGDFVTVPVCMVYKFRDGLIERIDEYTTESRAAPLQAAIMAALGPSD